MLLLLLLVKLRVKMSELMILMVFGVLRCPDLVLGGVVDKTARFATRDVWILGLDMKRGCLSTPT